MEKQIKIGLFVLFVGIVVATMATGLSIRSDRHSFVEKARGSVYDITPEFLSDRLNSRMLVSSDFRFNPYYSLAQTLSAIRRQFPINLNSNAVAHGNAAHVPVGWAFIALRNTTSRTQHLVLYMPQYRCNRATLFMGRDSTQFKMVGTVRITTPLGKRFFPSLNFAFPIILPSQSTISLLLRTESRVGFHEIDVRLAKKEIYFETSFIDSIRDGSQVIACFILAVVALMLGWRSENKLMLTFGVYIFSLGLAFSCLFGYLSFLPYPIWTSINAATLGTLFRLGVSITLHPFLYEVVKPAIRNRRRYKLLVAGFCTVSAFVISLHLMPYRYYGYVNYSVNLAMTYLDIINTGWIVYVSVLAYRRARIVTMLVVCLMLFVPVVANLILFLIQNIEGQDSFRTPVMHPMLLIIVLSYLIFEQFRKQVVTRQLLREQVLQTQEKINALRRREIEGIGRNLHDQVGNTLATVLSYLDRLPADTEKLRTIIVSTINELRFMSHNLVKDDERPLTEKVDTLVSRFNDFASIQLFHTDYTHRQIDQLSAIKQQNMYSIIQELLTNIIRHSQASHAYVQFFYDGTTVDVSVEDDGIGFHWSEVSAFNGIGIQNIHKRAALSNIEVSFDSAPTGTTILLKTLLADAIPNDSY